MKMGARIVFAVAALFLGTGFALAAESEQAAQKPYTVEDGKVDKKTFNGWRRYTESCQRGHDQRDATLRRGRGRGHLPRRHLGLFEGARRRRPGPRPTATDWRLG